MNFVQCSLGCQYMGKSNTAGECTWSCVMYCLDSPRKDERGVFLYDDWIVSASSVIVAVRLSPVQLSPVQFLILPSDYSTF